MRIVNSAPLSDRRVRLETGSDFREGDGRQLALVAVDLGAESCRVSLLKQTRKRAELKIVHRFPNAVMDRGNGLRWDLERLCAGVEVGLRACADRVDHGITAVGVDGWAVDYVRLGGGGKPKEDPFCYRDERTVEAERVVNSRISIERLYELTGIQHLRINTLYQLYADGLRGMDQRIPWTNLPEYVLSGLGGRRVAEYTNATHTQLVSLAERSWCQEIFAASGLQLEAAPTIVPTGTDLGTMGPQLAALPAFRETRLIAPACHDTASAIAGIPAEGDDWAFISSGTWSLVGAVLEAPCVSELARHLNFSNEGGVGGRTYFLKNVNGMWLLSRCLEQWRARGDLWTVSQLIEACASMPAPPTLIDVDDPDFLLPGDMLARIDAHLTRRGDKSLLPGGRRPAETANLLFHSLAFRYAQVLADLARVTNKPFKRVYIVGGGSQNSVLNQLTAKATGLEVVTGSTESTTIGNFAVQLAALEGGTPDRLGVSAAAVTKWARIIGEQATELDG